MTFLFSIVQRDKLVMYCVDGKVLTRFKSIFKKNFTYIIHPRLQTSVKNHIFTYSLLHSVNRHCFSQQWRH